ncbi:M3 family metallopeptidase [Geitlerinema sp. PCC 9228]|uniref:M3 family oligoendopeptidase n=1 Tax=Geitlerinema sp. PCC 9228 TaxID=111611 RepID=UPI001FCD19BC|nr:M3 family metallopeptidase [Geitlerinema sp. PCC 9228]
MVGWPPTGYAYNVVEPTNILQNFYQIAFHLMTATQLRSIEQPQEWNLSDLYRGFDDPQLQADLQSLQTQAQEFRDTYRSRVAQLTPEEIAKALQTLEAIAQKSDAIYSYPYLVFAADTRNSEAKKLLDRVMEAIAGIENQLLFFELELQQLEATHLQQLQNHASLTNYRHYLHRLVEKRPYKLSEAVEQARNQSNLTGREAFIQLRSLHLGEQEYEPVTTNDGNTASTEAELSALLFQANPDIRYQAYRSVRNVLKEHNSLYGYILNTVARDHRIENEMRGYQSTLQKQLLLDEVSESVFRAIMDSTRERFDLFQQYYHLKGEALGQKIRICDIYAPWDNNAESAATISYQEGIATLLEALEQFDINYARRAEEFFLKNWVDAKVRPGKRGGAFCSYIHGKHSYILLSYTNDYNSLFTLAHELGHGLHFDWIEDRQSYFNSDPPMVLAEVASTFNELLLLDRLLEKSQDNPTLRKALLTRQLEDQLNLLFRQSTISRLELKLHERAAEVGSFDHRWVNEQWMSLYEELTGDAVALLPEHQYDWARIGHIFFKPFYCYQYTASNIVSLACYQKYRQVGKDFIPGYLELLASGGSMNQVDALRRYVDVDLEDPATIGNALEYVEGLLAQLKAIL